ncbi:hypothetical protein EG328_002543 [Venturia inaequalis]|nr:hypothetical protein EG328_002543 [Venturia inaequalis]RDI85291.1 hypothetical protein Vi05172_g4849 [Venturia inaequalis]
MYKTVAQIAENFQQDGNFRRGFGLTSQEGGWDVELLRWASLRDGGLQKTVVKPKIKEGTWELSGGASCITSQGGYNNSMPLLFSGRQMACRGSQSARNVVEYVKGGMKVASTGKHTRDISSAESKERKSAKKVENAVGARIVLLAALPWWEATFDFG